MKSFIVFALVLATALAAPQSNRDAEAGIIRYDSDNIGLGAYNYNYETSNGIQANEKGDLKNAGTENEAIVVEGRYSYVGPDGVLYSVVYTADENGFNAKGDHLPHNP